MTTWKKGAIVVIDKNRAAGTSPERERYDDSNFRFKEFGILSA